MGSKRLIESCDITLVFGRRYGFVGRNGLGKTTLLKMIGNGQLRLPSNINVLHVEQEVDGDDTSVLDAVLLSDRRRTRLLEREERLNEALRSGDGDSHSLQEQLKNVYADMAALELEKAPARAAGILFGLGFTPEQQHMATRYKAPV